MNNLKDKFYAFFISCLPKKYQLSSTIKLIFDKQVKEIIRKESEWMAKEDTDVSFLYWEAFKEMMLILDLLNDRYRFSESLFLVAEIIDTRVYHEHLYMITEMVHDSHPEYMRHSIDMMKARYHIKDWNS